ncbi:MAG: hypothetical protein LC775_06555, partial [Acidobacteria bacterium]|nr:hypothetical protein [Acidobacteriota bacterium]
MLLAIASPGLAPANLYGQDAADEVRLKKTTEALYQAIERNDLTSYLTFWTEQQQRDKDFVQDLEKFLALAKERRYEHLTFSRISLSGDRASLRVDFNYSDLDDKTNKRRTTLRVFHNLSFTKENGNW